MQSWYINVIYVRHWTYGLHVTKAYNHSDTVNSMKLRSNHSVLKTYIRYQVKTIYIYSIFVPVYSLSAKFFFSDFNEKSLNIFKLFTGYK